MNLVVMMGRLTKDPEVRYGGASNTCVANYSIAVDRTFKREGEPDTDFFNLVSFGKQGEFVEKYLKKGTKIVIKGELKNNNYMKDGKMVYRDVIQTTSVEFAESKRVEGGLNTEVPAPAPSDSGEFMYVPDNCEELPFN